MILDSSAIVAIFLGEPERDRFSHAIDEAETVGVGTPTLVETAMVLRSRLGDRALVTLDGFLRASDVTVVAFETRHWQVAVEAFVRYGNGRHPAALNYGDCLTYATAKVAGVPLLAKGQDFALTDLELA